MVIIKLNEKLEELNITKYQLHQLTGIRPNTIADMCNLTTKTVSLENLDKICKAIKCLSLSDIIEFIPDVK